MAPGASCLVTSGKRYVNGLHVVDMLTCCWVLHTFPCGSFQAASSPLFSAFRGWLMASRSYQSEGIEFSKKAMARTCFGRALGCTKPGLDRDCSGPDTADLARATGEHRAPSADGGMIVIGELRFPAHASRKCRHDVFQCAPRRVHRLLQTREDHVHEPCHEMLGRRCGGLHAEEQTAGGVDILFGSSEAASMLLSA